MSLGPKFDESLNLFDYYLGERLAQARGTHPAIRWGATIFDYNDVYARSMALAAWLSRSGVRRGERVLIVLPDSPVWAWAIFGTFAAGAVVCMGNPDAPMSQLEYLVEYTRATALITLPALGQALEAAVVAGRVRSELQVIGLVADYATGAAVDAACPVVTQALRDAAAVPGHCKVVALADAASAAVSHSFKRPQTHRDEPCMWLFTSGTTGASKANIHTHRDFAFNTEVFAKRTLGYAATDITVSVSRLYFGYATGTNLFFPFAVGASTALFSERPSPQVLVENLRRYSPTIVTNVPTMLAKLLEYDASELASGRSGLDLSSVRFSLSAGEALPEALLRRYQARFASDVYDGIGSAEMFHIYASNRPGDIKPGSLGRAVEGYSLSILPEEASGLGAAPCAPGEIGVLWVRGDSVSQGYWLDRDKSFTTFFGHACRTGDLFHVDENGYLYFDGRADDLLKIGGLWVSPHEVEEALCAHPQVQLAAVIGVSDGGLTRLAAVVVPAVNANVLSPQGGAAARDLAESLVEHVRARLSRYKVPKIYRFVADVPKNDRGKVDKKAVRAEAEALGQSAFVVLTAAAAKEV
jgi:acyl-coenzyme A synthetase/AMP-(fatty) acid ligase